MKDLHLGPRALIVNGKLLGTCEDLHLTIVEATDEEIQELQDADEIHLVKMKEE